MARLAFTQENILSVYTQLVFVHKSNLADTYICLQSVTLIQENGLMSSELERVWGAMYLTCDLDPETVADSEVLGGDELK